MIKFREGVSESSQVMAFYELPPHFNCAKKNFFFIFGLLSLKAKTKGFLINYAAAAALDLVI